jgi:subtilisin-like proprotein convertase family protein
LLNSPGKISALHGGYDTAWKFETTMPNEYFMIENRSQMDLDAHLPSSGLAIYHCDTLGSNEWQDGTRNRHYQCALLQADGSLDLENNRNAGDSTDLFKESPGVVVSHATMPSSRMWDGTDSGLVVSEVSAPGRTVAFTIGEPQDQPVAEVEAFPNLIIPDNDPNGATSTLDIESTGEITDVSVNVEIIHSWISDLKVSLVSPNGAQVVLHDHEGQDGDDIRKTYDSATVAGLADLRGSELRGNWSLVVIDKASLDVGRLVRWGLAVRYQRRTTTVTGNANPNLDIPDADVRGISSGIEIQQDGALKNIAVSVEIEHTYVGDLRIDLVSPAGRAVRLHHHAGGSSNDIKRSYDPTSTPDLNDLIGEAIRGNWQLQVRDLAAADNGTLISWSIDLEY